MLETTNVDTTPAEVDINTDNLDDFALLMSGKASVKPDDPEPEPEDSADESEVDVTVDDEAPEPEVTPEAEDTTDEPEDIFKPKAKKPTAQERINELTRLRYEAERREADASRREAEVLRQLAEVQARINQPRQPESPALTDQAPNPDALDQSGQPVYSMGEFDPKYIRDLTQFTIRQETAELRKQTQEEFRVRQEQETNRQQQVTWDSRLTEAEKEFPDLRPTLASLEPELADTSPEMGLHLAQTVMAMEHGPAVLYYLANHLDEARSIVASGVIPATLALGKLEGRIAQALSTRNQPKTVKVSNAPEPPAPIRGTSSSSGINDDTDDLDAFSAKFFKSKRR